MYKYKNIRYIHCLIGFAVLAVFFTVVLKTNFTDSSLLIFSRDSGFYDEDFYLEIYAPDGGTIYYTLDSSEPDINSSVYTGPILITDASNKDNVYSMVTDVTLDYQKELLEQAGVSTIYGYELPKQKIDKGTVVRAVTINDNGEKGQERTEVYWVDFEKKNAYDNFNIISVTTDPDNLFDYESGIYVTGKYFDNTLVDGKVVTPVTPNFGWWEANYTQRGTEWEKEAQVLLWNQNRELLCEGSFGVRIQGGSSRGMANKSLNLFARKEYGMDVISGVNIFSDAFPMGSLNLYSGAQCVQTKLQDYLANTLASNLNISTREFQPYILFLDGEFWGVYWLLPRYEAEYFYAKYDVYKESVIEIKLGGVEIGNAEDVKLYNDMVSAISAMDMSVPENYAKACEMIDIESYLDYYATEIYIANLDWPNNNYALWRTRDVASGKYADGRWRWILFDVNLSMASQNARADWIEYAAVTNDMFASMMYSDEFKSALEKRLVYLAQNNFNPNVINSFIDDYEARMADAMELEYQRFYGDNKTMNSFYGGCEDIRLFFSERYKYIMEKYGGNKVDG